MTRLLGLVLFLGLMVFGVWPNSSLAVTETTIGGTLLADISPAYPGPNENVNIKLKSYGFDLDRAFITWKVNGAIAAAGVGKKELNFNTGVLGSTALVEIVAAEANQQIKKTITIKPATLALIVEADSQTPPFYKGKALATPGAAVKLIAVPDFKDGSRTLNSQELIFDWFINDKKMPDASGVGKSSLATNIPSIGAKQTISVVVGTPSGSVSAKTQTALTGTVPKILVYPYSSLTGPAWNQALNYQWPAEREEISLFGFAYFAPHQNSSSTIWWQAGNESARGPLFEITGKVGSAKAIKVQHVLNNVINAGAEKQLLIQFK